LLLFFFKSIDKSLIQPSLEKIIDSINISTLPLQDRVALGAAGDMYPGCCYLFLLKFLLCYILLSYLLCEVDLIKDFAGRSLYS
jgi:hypothetical protein